MSADLESLSNPSAPWSGSFATSGSSSSRLPLSPSSSVRGTDFQSSLSVSFSEGPVSSAMDALLSLRARSRADAFFCMMLAADASAFSSSEGCRRSAGGGDLRFLCTADDGGAMPPGMRCKMESGTPSLGVSPTSSTALERTTLRYLGVHNDGSPRRTGSYWRARYAHIVEALHSTQSALRFGPDGRVGLQGADGACAGC